MLLMIVCPTCNSLSTIPIAYGKPSIELEEAAARGLVEIAGCVVDQDSPSMRCLDCGIAWATIGAASMHPADPYTTLQEVKEIVERYLHPIYAGMISSELFSESSSDWGAVYSYLRLKEVLGIYGGCTSDQVDAVLMFKRLNPDQYDRIVKELEYQVCVLSMSNRWPGGLHGALFTAAALVFNASPMSYSDPDPRSMEEFESTIRQGSIGFE